MTEFDDRLNVGWWALKIGLGVGPIITGSIDKYFNNLADWGMYLSPLATKVMPVNTATFLPGGGRGGGGCRAVGAEPPDEKLAATSSCAGCSPLH
jgi:hypothetical protein